MKKDDLKDVALDISSQNIQESPSKRILKIKRKTPSNNLDEEEFFEAYLEKKLPIGFKEAENFWNFAKTKYPSIWNLLKKYFSFPSSTIIVEGTFSIAKYMLTDRSASMTVEILEERIYLKKNKTFFNNQ